MAVVEEIVIILLPWMIVLLTVADHLNRRDLELVVHKVSATDQIIINKQHLRKQIHAVNVISYLFFIIGGKVRPRNAICSLTIGKGTCKATLRRFYFDMRSGTCKLFIFGGCQGTKKD